MSFNMKNTFAKFTSFAKKKLQTKESNNFWSMKQKGKITFESFPPLFGTTLSLLSNCHSSWT